MKKKVVANLQEFAKGIFVPVLILPIVGILFAFASVFTNSRVHKVIPILSNDIFVNFGKILGQSLIPIIGTYLGILFAVGISIGMAKKEKHHAALVGMLSYFVFIHSMNVYMGIKNLLVPVSSLRGSGQTMMMGIQIIDMGIFLGIALGLIVAYIHNKYVDQELKGAFQIYGGPRLVFIVSSLTMILCAVLSTHFWPSVQSGINYLSQFIEKSGVFGIFSYGFLERILIPTGLHHLIYPTFLYTNFGGSEVVEVIQNGEIVKQVFEGSRNIYNAQLSNIDNISQFTKHTVWDARGISKIFGLWGAAYAIYKTSKEENKFKVKTILLSAMAASTIAGVTEPIEFSFLFTAPILFGVHAVLSGLGMAAFYLLDLRSIVPNGIIDFLLINIPAGIDRTGWPILILLGIFQAFVYYFSFKFLIEKLSLKTPGREEESEEVKLYSKSDYVEKNNKTQDLGFVIIDALGGKDNIDKVENCYTRLRVTIKDSNLIDEKTLLKTGASNIIKIDDFNVQIIYGIKVRSIRNNVENCLGTV
ncbi:MAG: PTS transporter subunit EIIC [Cetobacterium sp.]